VKQTEVKDKEQQNDRGKNPKKYSLLFAVVPEQGKKKYVQYERQ
jgi:hypothetical protein